mmetsp:Transcript_26256/g.29374  ORF Transcript_26256/g.29374 Transcript_26256/m.29374 type:complete len:91 (+) Transcript_26256:535-807(+)
MEGTDVTQSRSSMSAFRCDTRKNFHKGTPSEQTTSCSGEEGTTDDDDEIHHFVSHSVASLRHDPPYQGCDVTTIHSDPIHADDVMCLFPV